MYTVETRLIYKLNKTIRHTVVTQIITLIPVNSTVFNVSFLIFQLKMFPAAIAGNGQYDDKPSLNYFFFKSVKFSCLLNLNLHTQNCVKTASVPQLRNPQQVN